MSKIELPVIKRRFFNWKIIFFGLFPRRPLNFLKFFENFIKVQVFLGVRFLNIGAYTFESENRMLKRLMAILIEFLSGSHAETHYSWLFMKISQWNGIIIKNNIKWYLDQIQIITCHIPKSTWLKIFESKNPISIKNARRWIFFCLVLF